MLNNISWASYAYAISTIVVIYYVLVIALFFRRDLQGLLLRHPITLPDITDNGTSVSASHTQNIQENCIGSDTNELLLSLQSLIKKAAARKFPKEELLLSLQLKLQNYPALNNGLVKGNINNFIKTACENNCSIHLLDNEVKVLWGVEVGGAS